MIWGSGIRGAPGFDMAVRFRYDELRALPSVTRTVFLECTGNGRSFYTTQQGDTSPAPLGGSAASASRGGARWRGVPRGAAR
ncbi:molybdopterin-dependent oxidoreductase [Streptomyces gobiensis]|uniref:molybdopterin-dependent oxidoreductase n=1 Tax=Streptomyces gobiensis TaxID=2875706 RepID=UPI003BAF3DC3